MEIFQVIALLCQVSTSDYMLKTVDSHQHSCQKYYVQCMQKKANNGRLTDPRHGTEQNMAACIQERKP